jgi:hypothetical protein
MKLRLLLTFVILTCSVQSYADEGDLYNFLWLDPDKSVYVLQNKIFTKKNTIYGELGGAYNMSSEYQDTLGVNVKAGYYFLEEWAVELDYKKYFHTDNSTYDSL